MQQELIERTVKTLASSQDLLEAVVIQVPLTLEARMKFKRAVNDIDDVIREIKGIESN